MRTRYLIALLSLLLLWLAACGEEEPPTPTAEPTPATTATPAATIATTPTITQTPSPTLTPSATPVMPEIEVQSQTIFNDQQLTVGAITSPSDGWLAVYIDTQAALDSADLLGVIPIEAGDSTNLVIPIDAEEATETLQIALHGGRNGTNEDLNPAEDQLLLIETVSVELQINPPEIAVAAQEVFDDGVVTIQTVTLEDAGWLGIHNQEDGGLGQLLGYVPVQAGTTQNLPVAIRWREANPALVAVLYEDAGESAVFEYDAADAIITYAEEPVTTSFEVTLPMDIVVFDQPVVDGEFVIERIVSNGPGWVVVYQVGEDGSQGFIIGTVPLVDGLNEDILVEVDGSAVTDSLQLTIHDDTTPGDEFDFPANDPRRDYLGRAVVFPLNTLTGSYFVVRDQPLADNNQVTVDIITTEVDAWLVVYADAAGEPGEIIGQTAVPAGFSRDVAITIENENTAAASNQLHLMLHVDVSAEEAFNPEEDTPLLQRGFPVMAPFLITDQE